ncbi:alanine--tRNA ligase [Nanoarchaeota archaeon]
MKTDKEIKKEFKIVARKNPEKYYPVEVLKKLGFKRAKCSKCGTFYWSTGARKTCGDTACEGGFSFIGKSPAKRKLDYVQTWHDFSKIHKKMGYTPISRYPVVARWRDDTDFVQAGIYDFQPWVVSGEVKPPANPVTEPQFCLRFNDIDNVGVTGAHYVGFVMLGEHAFMPPEKFNIGQYLQDHLVWINKGMGVNNRDLILHEDVWAGGGNFGPSIEFFSGGMELSNQVYMTHEVTPAGSRELKIKVLDMGQGMERVPWFTQGKSTSYETTFPLVMKRLKEVTGVKVDEKFLQKFSPYQGLLNVDEVEDVGKVWNSISRKLGLGAGELKEKITTLASLYSVAEHSRALLVALNDGALPSNVGGGYNLRVILRRALSLIDKYDWDLYLPDICNWHADYLKKLFPELRENLGDVRKILDVEKNKFENTKAKSAEIVKRIIKTKITGKKLLELYDSQGITPELIKEEAENQGVKVKVPGNFFAKVAELHEKKVRVMAKKEKELNLIGLPETDAKYFDDWKDVSFSAKVLKIDGKFVVLDQTLFYPESGGQDKDEGVLNADKVVRVFKQGSYIVHELASKPGFKVGDGVRGKIDLNRRKQLTQHHTAAHIVNAAARRVLGNHINQSGAKKTVEKGHLDITHYESLSDEEVVAIEKEANKIIGQKIRINSLFLPRDEAEKKYTTRIYQGGAVPGNEIRIVEIVGVDAEACGGTHLKNTKEAEEIKITGSTKIQDGVVRIEYKAGLAAKQEEEKLGEIEEKIKSLVKREMDISVEVAEYSLKLAADELKVPEEQLLSAIKKFVDLFKDNEKKLKKVGGSLIKFDKKITLENFCRDLFTGWKKQNKELEGLRHASITGKLKGLAEGSVKVVDLDVKELREAVTGFAKVLLVNRKGNFVFKGTDKEFKKLIDLGAKGGGNELKQGVVATNLVNSMVKLFKF